MRYLIAHMIKGEIGYKLRSLSDELADVFWVSPVSERTDPRLTIKAPFEAHDHNLPRLEHALADFAKNHSKAKIVYDRLGHFNKRVLFIDVQPSPQAEKLVTDLLGMLRQFSWIVFVRSDGEKHLHATIANVEKRSLCEEMRTYAEGEIPRTEAVIDCIALLREEKGRWRLHAEYELGV
jgi:2'-5' RNA ligase